MHMPTADLIVSQALCTLHSHRLSYRMHLGRLGLANDHWECRFLARGEKQRTYFGARKKAAAEISDRTQLRGQGEATSVGDVVSS